MEQNENKYCYRYPHPALTADCVVFGFNGRELKVLLIERGLEPFLGCWALPGGFMKIDEPIEKAAARELYEETGLSGIYLEQFKTFSSPDRDPRERVVTVAFIALVKPDDYRLVAGDDAVNAHWFLAHQLPPLAFDHRTIIKEARQHLKEIIRLKPVAFELLNKTFTISELQTLYEVINEVSYDRRNFMRAAIDSSEIVDATPSGENSSRRVYSRAAAKEKLNADTECYSSTSYSCTPTHDSDLELIKPAPGLKRKSQSNYQLKATTSPPKASTKGLFDFIKSAFGSDKTDEYD
ncbi:MAG: NUDIX hydrolase [Muribaculaceae bacterium]|nr:NUDIX hydrolase [Muribaculaceae bacterium]